MKHLCKSAINKRLFGVCGGLGEYLGCDPTIIRFIWALSFFVFGIGGLAYLAAALIMPTVE